MKLLPEKDVTWQHKNDRFKRNSLKKSKGRLKNGYSSHLEGVVWKSYKKNQDEKERTEKETTKKEREK